MGVDDLRDELREVDRRLVRLAADRVRLSRAIAREKAEAGLPTVDFAQERRVLERARDQALAADLDATVAERLLLPLIETGVAAQEEERLRLRAGGQGRSAVVVGGAGRMGQWFVRFLAAQGHHVTVHDPADGSAEGPIPDTDLVLVATPPRVVDRLYRAWAEAPPSGVIVDVASIKTPLRGGLRALQAAGGRVASLHPLFGPATRVLRDLDVVVCDTGDAGAQAEAEALFEATTVRLVHVPLDEHDRWMADVLALAHAAVLAFAAALPDGPLPVRSQTLGRLSDLAWDVVHESPDVYYEIQAHNPYARHAVTRLRRCLDHLEKTVLGRDPAGFSALMADGRDHLRAQRREEGP